MSFSRGDVVLVLFPDSNLLTAKRRPALVVQADGLETGIPQIILAMISSNPARKGHPSRATVSLDTPEGERSGLRIDSVIMTDNLATVLEREIDKSIGRWTDWSALDAALRHTLGL
ncbi:MAG: transcriptional regulator [Armatimonadetes bacterium CG2_30_59_28]|nr:type II toxin-antitoxin system PemK/MazF family toxin [Armatimonadota bacterium]OIO95208.1 MAG: transcriptional regulator [Armatimonadetes bacterium CG2_30_59_28]PIU63758.1 MAG: transcriptional regulator [Armatimonadetes bacterium CG07_land_8_20_14_0_80_59_28]PIX44313.1 MAG: transcriptional regulator [Armatimonadetes bacterium CG_4_8_14_3_um_filter_58_9]PIY44396.1 MAG: transcriptional regulator [Armatimonadetes bacterium CG_4_10_14_3_um_filter_59_10]